MKRAIRQGKEISVVSIIKKERSSGSDGYWVKDLSGREFWVYAQQLVSKADIQKEIDRFNKFINNNKDIIDHIEPAYDDRMIQVFFKEEFKDCE